MPRIVNGSRPRLTTVSPSNLLCPYSDFYFSDSPQILNTWELGKVRSAGITQNRARFRSLFAFKTLYQFCPGEISVIQGVRNVKTVRISPCRDVFPNTWLLTAGKLFGEGSKLGSASGPILSVIFRFRAICPATLIRQAFVLVVLHKVMHGSQLWPCPQN